MYILQFYPTSKIEKKRTIIDKYTPKWVDSVKDSI